VIKKNVDPTTMVF